MTAPFELAAVALVFMLAVMSTAWLTQRAAKNAGWIDVFWTFGTGATLVLAALWHTDALPPRQWLVAALGGIWAVRLGTYIALRVASSREEDVRYKRLRAQWGAGFQSRVFGFALLQAPAGALLAFCVFLAAHAGPGVLTIRDAIGAALLAVAIVGEGVADEQLRRFKRTAAKGAVMDKGLWGLSRHPNYFFEWVGWLAYPVIAIDPAYPLSYASLIAPAVMYVILRYGTGVPMLERVMLESRGDAFRDYQKRVSPFFPLPPRKAPK